MSLGFIESEICTLVDLGNIYLYSHHSSVVRVKAFRKLSVEIFKFLP